MSRWYPHATVAAIVEDDGRFLMVQERSSSGEIVVNQPAGHIEDGESIIEALVRETLEETGHEIDPVSLVGIYRWVHPAGHTFLRFTFAGTILRKHDSFEIDPDIIRPLWLTPEDIRRDHTPRSPLVLENIADYLQGHHYPLDILKNAGHG
jgi:8-oxo-dGTP pyrophosphatase MutT (NUDIX family)